MSQSFMMICPRSKEYTGYNVTGIPLKVIQSNGVELNPHIKFTEAELENGAKYFHNNSGRADSFSITCLLDDGEQLNLVKKGDSSSTKKFRITTILDYFIRKGEPFYVVSRAKGVSKKFLWIVTANSSRKQHYDDGYLEWELTFTRMVEFKLATFKKQNKGVTSALNKYAKKKASAKKNAKKQAKGKTSVKYQFKKKCKPKNLKYSKNKKVVKCVKLMQKLLYKKGFLKTKKQIDGWYGKTTVTAVKNFQKTYAKKYKLKKSGKVDKATFKALYKA